MALNLLPSLSFKLFRRNGHNVPFSVLLYWQDVISAFFLTLLCWLPKIIGNGTNRLKWLVFFSISPRRKKVSQLFVCWPPFFRISIRLFGLSWYVNVSATTRRPSSSNLQHLIKGTRGGKNEYKFPPPPQSAKLGAWWVERFFVVCEISPSNVKFYIVKLVNSKKV